MTATATHDTKRGEDARARILALSEVADEWSEAVTRWRVLNAGLIDSLEAANRPSPAHQYMLYQALVGAWPLDRIDKSFVERMQAYAVKAAREAKQQTSWLMPDSLYETGLTAFVEQLLDRNRSAAFLDAFEPFARRVALLGALTSLSQLALKLTMPGVPDLYQGTELWDLSLVDPDNRRPVDFATRAAARSSIGDQPDWHALAEAWPDGRVKLALTQRLLSLRRQMPAVFTDGSYRPIDVVGPHRDEIIAFARMHGRDAVVVGVARSFSRATKGGQHWPAPSAWDAALCSEGFLPVGHASGERPLAGAPWPIADLFDTVPVAVMPARTRLASGARPAAAVAPE